MPWLDSLQVNKSRPAPVGMQLVSILDLIARNSAGFGATMSTEQLSAQVDALSQFIEHDYCGMVPGCEEGISKPRWSADERTLLTPTYGSAAVES